MAEFVEVIAAGPGWTRVKDSSGRVLTLDGNRNWRNNNPGNIEYGPFARSMGAIGSDGRFAVFPSYEAGRQAKEGLLFSSGSYANKTLAQAISRYAPPNENNTQAYINAVANAVGITPNTVISSLNPAQRSAMLDAMEQVEGFKVGEIRNAQGVKLPPAEVPQVATALDVIERTAPTPASQSSAMGYARATTPSAFAPPPTPLPRPERTRTAPVPASVEQRVTARNSQVSAPPPMPRSRPTAPKTEIYTGPSVPIGLMMLADTPNAATPRLQSNGSVRSPMAMPPTPASVEQRVTARNNPPPAPPTPRSRPPRTYGESNLIADSFAAQSAAARPELQTALNQKYGPTGIGSMPSFAALQNFAGTNVPDRLTAGIDQVTAYPRPTQVAQTPPLPRARPQTGVGGPLPPIAPPMPPAVQPVAPAGPKVAPVPVPRLQRPGIFGTPKIGNWEVPLPGILGTVQNITAAMNNAGGPFNNGADNLLYNAMRGGNFASPGGGMAQSAGFRYAQGPNGWVNVGAVNPDLTPAQRYTLANAANRGLGGPNTQGNWLATSGGAGASESSGEGNYTPWMAPGSTAERLAKLKEQQNK